MSSFDLHNDADRFPDPGAWEPERWLNKEDGTFNHRLGKYIVPFSRGTRSCLGMNLAWAEMYLTLGNLFGPQSKMELELFETGIGDVEVAHDFFNPSARLDSKGVRVLVKRKGKH